MTLVLALKKGPEGPCQLTPKSKLNYLSNESTPEGNWLA